MSDTCSKCSAPLDTDAVFCPSCAEPISPQCPNCKKSVSADAKFCKYCAHVLTKEVAGSQVVNPNVPQINAQVFSPTVRIESSLDATVRDNIHDKSDEDLLAMMSADLDAFTPKAFSYALVELEARPHLNEQRAEIAKARVRELLQADELQRSKNAPAEAAYNAAKQLAREKAGRLMGIGAITAIVSAIAFVWGNSYVSDYSNVARAGIGNLMGQTDSTYMLAQWCVTLGVIGFLVGLVLFIVGWVQRSS